VWCRVGGFFNLSNSQAVFFPPVNRSCGCFVMMQHLILVFWPPWSRSVPCSPSLHFSFPTFHALPLPAFL